MNNIDKLVRPLIKDLKPYSSARDEFSGMASVFLDANENPYNNGFNRYPDPYQRDLKKKISILKNIREEMIFLGNGSDEIIDLLFRVFCEPSNDNVVILPPTYGMYKVCASINNIEVKEILLDNTFQPDTAAILSAADANTKLFFVCSPNNPTANSVEKEKLLELLNNFKGIVIVDEAYVDFAQTNSLLPLLSEFPNLVVLQTFSKAWGMAGVRLGMAFCNEKIVYYLNKVKPPYNVNVVTQRIVSDALDRVDDTRKNIESIICSRELLVQKFDKFSFVDKIFPSDANFILVKVKNADELYNFLSEKNIIIRNRSNAEKCRNCLRITVGTPEENDLLTNACEIYDKLCLSKTA